jgi:cellulose biosynthesis protein BcsQ
MTTSSLEKLLDRFAAIAKGENVAAPQKQFEKYAVSNFRGGIGKTTLAFNLAFEASRHQPVLLFDLCPQRSFSELLLGDVLQTNDALTIYDALLPKVLSGAGEPDYEELTYRVSSTCPAFKGGRPAYLVAGSSELFLFPSNFYNALTQVASLGDKKRVKSGTDKILGAFSEIIDTVKADTKTTKVIVDTSPFFAGGTHLAWAAVDALVIPVRVDRQSVDALRLTLEMLRNPSMDFLRINAQAGRTSVPKVHAIAMTHCGWARTKEYTPDQSTQSFVSKVLELTSEYADLFSSNDPTDCIFLMDDFHSAGRISGEKRIPLAQLNVGEWYNVGHQRLQVNESLSRYQREVQALAASL